MLIEKINKLYDVRIYYMSGKHYKEQYLANVLEFYKSEGNLTIVQFDESKQDLVYLVFKQGSVLRSFTRDDALVAFRDEEGYITFTIATDKVI